jgi:hypothetical protein
MNSLFSAEQLVSIYGFSETIKDLAVKTASVAKEQVGERLNELHKTAATMINSHISNEPILPEFTPNIKKDKKSVTSIRSEETLQNNVSNSIPKALTKTMILTKQQRSRQNVSPPQKENDNYSLSKLNTIVNVTLIVMLLLLVIAMTCKYVL